VEGSSKQPTVSSSSSSSQFTTIKPNSISHFISYGMLVNTADFLDKFHELNSSSRLAASVAERQGSPFRLMAPAATGDEAAAVRVQQLWESSLHLLQPAHAGQQWLEDSCGPAYVAKLPLQLGDLSSNTHMGFVRQQAAAAGVAGVARLGHLGLRLQEGGPLVAVPCVLMSEVGGEMPELYFAGQHLCYSCSWQVPLGVHVVHACFRRIWTIVIASTDA
jgi:hypothetical protein